MILNVDIFNSICNFFYYISHLNIIIYNKFSQYKFIKLNPTYHFLVRKEKRIKYLKLQYNTKRLYVRKLLKYIYNKDKFKNLFNKLI